MAEVRAWVCVSLMRAAQKASIETFIEAVEEISAAVDEACGLRGPSPPDAYDADSRRN